MKRLTEESHQTSDDLTVMKAAYSLHVLFWRTIPHSGMKGQICSLGSGCA